MRHPWRDLHPAHPILAAALCAALIAGAGVVGFLTNLPEGITP